MTNEQVTRLATIDRCIEHSERTGVKLTNVLSSKQIRFLRSLLETFLCPTCGGELRGSFPECIDCQLIEAMKRGDENTDVAR